MSSSPFPYNNQAADADGVILMDDVGRSLECQIEHSLEIDGSTYVLLMPVDLPVVVIAWENEADDNAEAILLEAPEEIELIFDNAKAVLAELNLNLQHSAFTLTAQGDLPPLEDLPDELLALELEEQDSQLEAEELQLLVSFYHEAQKYSIYTPLAPLLFFAKFNVRGHLELVSPEDEQMQPILHDLLFEQFEN